jgi:hypothetical protein
MPLKNNLIKAYITKAFKVINNNLTFKKIKTITKFKVLYN